MSDILASKWLHKQVRDLPVGDFGFVSATDVVVDASGTCWVLLSSHPQSQPMDVPCVSISNSEAGYVMTIADALIKDFSWDKVTVPNDGTHVKIETIKESVL